MLCAGGRSPGTRACKAGEWTQIKDLWRLEGVRLQISSLVKALWHADEPIEGSWSSCVLEVPNVIPPGPRGASAQ